MTETYLNSFSENYLRPAYPIDFGGSHKATQTDSPYTAAWTAGLASLTRTVGQRGAQPTFADGFVWLLKVLLTNRAESQRLSERAETAKAASVEDAAQCRRVNRLLREVPAHLEAQARPTTSGR